MNKKELEKRKLVQKTVYASYYVDSVMNRKQVTANKLFNYGAKTFIERNITSKELELILEQDVLIKNIEIIKKQLKDAEDKLMNNELELENLKRLSDKVRAEIIAALEPDYIKFCNDYKDYYEKHPEEDIELGFYSNRNASINLLANKYQATEEEIIDIFSSYLLAKKLDELAKADLLTG